MTVSTMLLLQAMVFPLLLLSIAIYVIVRLVRRFNPAQKPTPSVVPRTLNQECESPKQ